MLRGQTILGYTLSAKLGQGGMAEVWRADNAVGESRAIKLLNEEFLRRDDVVERFRNEAQVMLQLRHHNICAVYEYSEELSGRPAILMELLEGQDLASLMQSGRRFGDSELIPWWNTLVDVLRYTHRQGIVHRDIKPSNIFLTTAGELKLLDFGVAKLGDSLTLTKTGHTIGTTLYMSPEQVRDSKHLDYKTDIYSLAVTFYHLLSGVAPYDLSTDSAFEVQMKICQEPLSLEALPSKWQTLLRPLLVKDPAERARLKKMRLPKELVQDKTEISLSEAQQLNQTAEEEAPAPKTGKSKSKPARQAKDKTQVIQTTKKEEQVKPFDIRDILKPEALACLDKGICPIDQVSPLSHTKYLYVGRDSILSRRQADYIPIGDKTYKSLLRRLRLRYFAYGCLGILKIAFYCVAIVTLLGGIIVTIVETVPEIMSKIMGSLIFIGILIMPLSFGGFLVLILLSYLYKSVDTLAEQYSMAVVKTSKEYPDNYVILDNEADYIKTTN